ncbi:MAG: type I-C CRISPR-associated protein Cas8c/Csd1 [Isosphaeraceae bacterium]|nr:type I-C CRISPR-associated protein Cas8c/Csd1 [Isosphaeraceae bacterium]
MSQPASGLLPALVGYYQRLENDPSEGVADYGFSMEKLHFAIVLEPDGTPFSFDDIRARNEKGKPIPRPLLVPDGGGRSGTGLKPFFCWDNTGYALGRDNKGKPERAEAMFNEFRELHKSFLTELDTDAGFVALCRFLDRWKPEQAESFPNWDEAAGLNVVFKLRAREGYVHQSEAVRAAWLRASSKQEPSESRVLGVSLVSGEEEELARLHPQIRGVAGANTTGAAIVSFNLDAFESYGKSQSFNAPVGTRDAFRYTTALNRLLADDVRRVRIGDATVVFWSDRAEGQDAESLLREIFGDGPKNEDAEHTATVERVRVFLDAARKGQLHDMLKDPDAPFYVLGLSPNASRLNVRYWLVGTVRQFAERLAEHVIRLEMTGARPEDPPLVIRRLLLETAREPKDIPPQLAGEVARAVLGGFPYPQALFNAVVHRVRADSQMNHRRASILKAHLIRNRNEEVPVALNKDHPDEAYQLGRLFAALEKTQEDASESKLNRTVKDHFFGSAAATPAIIFPRLMQLHQHHLNKLENQGFRIAREKVVGEIVGRIGRFPSHLSLENQGLFYIGYYHQRQDFFTKRTDSGKETNDE